MVEGFNALTLNPSDETVYRRPFYNEMSWNLQFQTGGKHEI